jgi:RNA polymerase sigma-70 factor (ECF subfamily)
MSSPSPSSVTQLLDQWTGGDRQALDALIPLVESELKRIAGAHLARERPNHTLQPTALVNEAYLQLVDQRSARWQSRAHFLAVAAQFMRRILVDHARRRNYQKRGGEQAHVPIDDDLLLSPERDPHLIALDEALELLAKKDARKARVAELRYFAGLNVMETAAVLEISEATVHREWRFVRAWLHRELT